MADDKDLELQIRAKNLTEQAFKAVSAAIKALEQQSDSTAKKGKSLGEAFGSFTSQLSSIGPRLGPVGAAVGNMASSMGSAATTAGSLTAALGPAGIAVGAVTVAAGAAGAAVIAAAATLVSFTKSAANLGDELLVLSQKTGVSVEGLASYKYIAQQTDASFESITSSVFTLGKNLAEGTEKTVTAVGKLGLSVRDLKASRPEDAFATVLTAIGRIPEAGQRAAAGTAIFGKQFKEIAQLTQQDFRALQEEAHKFGINVSTEMAIAGDRFNDAMATIGNAIENVKIGLGARLLPVGIAFVELFRDKFTDAIGKARGAGIDFGALIETVAVQIGIATAKIIEVTAGTADVLVQFFAGRFVKDLGLVNLFGQLLEAAGTVQTAMGSSFGPAVAEAGAKIQATTKDWATSIAKGSAEFHKLTDAARTAAEAVGTELPKKLAEVRADIAKAAEEARKAVGANIAYSDSLNAVLEAKARELALHREILAISQRTINRDNIIPLFNNRQIFETISGVTTLRSTLTGYKLQLLDLAQMPRELPGLISRTEADRVRAALADIREGHKETATEAKSVWADVAVSMERSFAGALTRMLTGGKGFWDSMKAAAYSALDQILGYFINTMVRAFATGQRANWAQMFGGAAGAFASGNAGYGGGGLGDQGPTLAMAGRAGGGVNWAGIAGGAGVGAGVGWSVGRATGSTAKGALAGAASGAAAGSFAGPWGWAVGAGVGALAGWLGARKANKTANADMEKIRGELLQTFGSMEALKAAAADVGVDIEKAFATKGVKGVKEFNAVVEEFQKKQNALTSALEKYGFDWLELPSKMRQKKLTEQSDTLLTELSTLETAGFDRDTALKKMAPAFNQIVIAAAKAGEKVPAALRPILLQLAKMGALSEDAKRALLGLPDAVKKTGVDLETVAMLAQKFGINVAELGNTFQQAKINASSKEITDAWEVLNKQGVDMNAVLRGMKDEIGQIVNDSIKFGTEIPDNMRPLIQELIRTGQLFDENGEAIDDISKLKFAAPVQDETEKITDGLDDIVAAIDRLTDALINDVPQAARTAAEAMDRELNRDFTPRVNIWRPPDNPELEVDDSFADGGLVTRDGVYRVGEGGQPEIVGPIDFITKALTGALERLTPTAGGEQRFVLQVDGKVLGEVLADRTRRNANGLRTQLRRAQGF